MTKLSMPAFAWFSSVALGVSACASNEASERPVASARVEPAPVVQSAVEPVSPTVMAPTADNDARSQAAHAAEARESRTGATETQTTDRDPQAVVERGHEDSTALDQGGHAADLAIAGKIKQAVADDDQLSFSARNVKISAEQGEVTLRGYVRSDTEKRVIAAYAQQVVGAGHVHNELEATR